MKVTVQKTPRGVVYSFRGATTRRVRKIFVHEGSYARLKESVALRRANAAEYVRIGAILNDHILI